MMGSAVLEINLRIKYENHKSVHPNIRKISYFNADSYYKTLHRGFTNPNSGSGERHERGLFFISGNGSGYPQVSGPIVPLPFSVPPIPIPLPVQDPLPPNLYLPLGTTLRLVPLK